MDATRTAKRLGAESVTCVYRRRVDDMTALAEEIEEAWFNSLLIPNDDTEEEDEGWPPYAIVLVCVGSAVLVLGVAGVFVAMYLKKKREAQQEAEATVNAYKRKKIDTTDDKTIDVYADEETQEKAEETAEEVVEQAVEEEVSEPVEAEIAQETEEVETVSEEEKTNE